MTDKILFVDDDQNLLESYQRLLHNHFSVHLAADGKEGLEAIGRHGPYAVVVSDFRMPGMNGVEFLSRIREVSPHSVRMLLTGFADVQTAIDAVNQGNIYRLLTKPCPLTTLTTALLAGIEQYHLITAERELLEKTLQGSIRILSEALSMANPEAFGRSLRITREARLIAGAMGIAEIWPLETAALLSQVGWITLPERLLRKNYQSLPLTDEETQIFRMYPLIASDLVAKIPRMEKIAMIIRYQAKCFDGSGIPHDSLRGEDIPLEARILKAAIDFDALKAAGNSPGKALDLLHERSEWYDSNVLAALQAVVKIEALYQQKTLFIKELKENMVLTEDILAPNGSLLVAKGQEVNQTILAHLNNYASNPGIKEPLHVTVPYPKGEISLSIPGHILKAIVDRDA